MAKQETLAANRELETGRGLGKKVMEEQLIRTAMVLGEAGVNQLKTKRVAVFGIGGVGGHVVEALARSGVGALDLIDNDIVNISNINRQIIATFDTVGQYKTKAMKERVLSIQPGCRVATYECFYLPEEKSRIPFEQFDYIIDAIDTVTAKIDLVMTAKGLGIPMISSMGTGNKLDPTRLEIADIYETSVCPLAKVMRRELKARNVPGLKVLYSREPAMKPYSFGEELTGSRRAVPGSTAFVPAVAGLIIAGEVIKELAGAAGYDNVNE